MADMNDKQKRLAYLEGFYAYFEDDLASSYCGALKVEWVFGWSDATKHCEDIEEDAINQWEADRQAEEEETP